MHDGMGATGDIQVWLRDRKVFSSQKGRGVGAGGGWEGGRKGEKGPGRITGLVEKTGTSH